ncbi:MAG: L,D-transpeptidase family protein [Gammaproteobacteria bacterium]
MEHALRRIEISIAEQKLSLLEGDEVLAQYSVSTAANGPGEIQDSECTPRGHHVIHKKIGAACPFNTVFVSRQPTGEIYTPALCAQFPERDWIVTRILWLCGTEPGRNLGGNVDSMSRYIYIHGAPEDVPMGRPGSRGCIRLRNHDVVELFDRVAVGTLVIIGE